VLRNPARTQSPEPLPATLLNDIINTNRPNPNSVHFLTTNKQFKKKQFEIKLFIISLPNEN